MGAQEERFIRMPEVMLITALSKAHIYSLISQGKFPKQVKLGPRASGWLYSGVKGWMDSKIAEAGLNNQPVAA